MRYSIVVPIYNVSQYLTAAIESVLKQNFTDYELILVNDGSTDSSLEICMSFAQKYSNIVIINKENGGLISARKAGFKAAKGQYIISLDGDDYLSDYYLSYIEAVLVKYEDLDMIWISGYDDFNGKLVKYESAYKGYFDKEKIGKEIIPHCINGITESYSFRNGIVYKIVKRSIILNNLEFYNDDICMGEDLLISTACLGDSNSIYISEKGLYNYRQFDKQMTKRYKKKLFQNEDLLIRNLMRIACQKSMPIENQLYRHALEIAKSTVYNEIRFQKSRIKVNEALMEIYSTELYKNMCIEMYTKDWTRNERIFAFLLKRKFDFLIKMLGKLNYNLSQIH